jgi:hypothetical protein
MTATFTQVAITTSTDEESLSIMWGFSGDDLCFEVFNPMEQDYQTACIDREAATRLVELVQSWLSK